MKTNPSTSDSAYQWSDLMAQMLVLSQLVNRNEARLQVFLHSRDHGPLQQLLQSTTRGYEAAIEVAHMGLDSVEQIIADLGTASVDEAASSIQGVDEVPIRTALDIKDALASFIAEVQLSLDYMHEQLGQHGPGLDVEQFVRDLLKRMQPPMTPRGPGPRRR